MEIADQEFGETFLLSQPVVDLLLGYFDKNALKTLRLVCQTSKKLVESPEIIRHFVVRVTGDVCVDDLLRAPNPVPWNSFLFPRRYRNHFSSAGIERFLEAYGELVFHLELESGWGLEEQVVPLIFGCTNLQSLRMDELGFNCTSDAGDLTRPPMEHWMLLRHFHVQKFVEDGKSTKSMWFFCLLLSICEQLESLTVPRFNLSGVGLDPEGFQRLVVNPLLDTIARGRLRSVTVSNYDFNDELLLQLAFACREMGTVLHTEFKNSEFLEDLPPEHLPVLCIIGNLHGVTDTIIRQPLTNVRLIRLGNLGFHIENDAYTMPRFRYLRDLEFNFLGFEDVEARHRLELFVDRLAGVRRPTVKSLCIQYAANPPMVSLSASPVYLCTNFLNLRVLRLTSWSSEDGECLKLWPLVGHTLVELELSHIRKLSDRGILGDDVSQPAFLQLKNLRKLTLQNWDCGPKDHKVTDLSFLHAFRHMRLQSFEFIQSRNFKRQPRNFSAKTLKAMWDGVFGENIQRYFLQGKNMMQTRPRAKKKPLSDQDVSLEDDGHPRLICCSII